MGSVTTAPSNGYPTLLPSPIYDLPKHSHRSHHLRAFLVRSFLNSVLMMNWVWIIKFLPVREQLVCKGGPFPDWLEPFDCYWTLKFVTIVLLCRIACFLLLLCSVLHYMGGSLTQSDWDYYLIPCVLCKAIHGNNGNRWCLDAMCYVFISESCYLSLRGGWSLCVCLVSLYPLFPVSCSYI